MNSEKRKVINKIGRITKRFDELERLLYSLKEKEKELIEELNLLNIKENWILDECVLEWLDKNNLELQEKIDKYLNESNRFWETEIPLRRILSFLEELHISYKFWKNIDVIWYAQSTKQIQYWLDE